MPTKIIAVAVIGLVAVASVIFYFKIGATPPGDGNKPPVQQAPPPDGLSQPEPPAPQDSGPLAWGSSFKDATIQAQRRQLPVLVRLTPVCFKKCPSCEAINKILSSEKIAKELSEFALVHFDLNVQYTSYDIPPSVPKIHGLTFFLPDGTFLKTIAGVPYETNLDFAFKRIKEFKTAPPLSFMPETDNAKKLMAFIKRIENTRSPFAEAKDFMNELQTGPETLRVLTEGLWAINVNERYIAAQMLTKLHDPSSYDELALALQDPDDAVAAQAIYGLGRIGNAKAEDFLIEKLNGSPDTQAQAAIALGYVKSQKSVDALCKLLSSSKNAIVRDSVLRALESVRDPSCIPAVRKALKDETAEIRADAARLLGIMKDESSLPDLRKVLLNEKESFGPRHQVTHALANIGGKESEKMLIDSIETSDQLLAGCVAESLGWLKSSDSAEKIAPILLFDNPAARGLAAIGLGDIGNLKYKNQLEQMLKNDTNKFAYFGAELGLCLMEPERDRAFLFEALKIKPASDDMDGRSVRAYAARNIGKIYVGNSTETPHVASLLIDAIDPDDWYLNREILAALKMLTGKELAGPPDDAPDAWEEIKKKLRE
ncbi:MAG: HEAT repeat domain-containing protein [Planctomycetes bacterium]|nr:HEAT repeat domain-containing protein [Planctomycetota bacterium]